MQKADFYSNGHADHADFADCCHTEITEITEKDEHEPMEQRGQSKRACNLPSRDRGRPKVNNTNNTNYLIRKSLKSRKDI